MCDFRTHYNYNYKLDQCAEINDRPSLTRTDGYLPPVIQIERLKMAGQRLAQYYSDNYDLEDFSKDYKGNIYFDPTNDRKFNYGDYMKGVDYTKQAWLDFQEYQKRKLGNETNIKDNKVDNNVRSDNKEQGQE